MTKSQLIPLAIALCGAACGESRHEPADGHDDDAAVDGEDEPGPGFEADPEPAGAAVVLDVDMTDPSAPVLLVRAARLGPVFGLALHVVLDGGYLEAGDPAVEPFLGAEEPGGARYLAVARPADVSLGAARLGPEGGEVDVSDPVLVATVPLTVLAAGSSRVEVSAPQARRADGSFVPVAAAGGLLTTGGAP